MRLIDAAGASQFDERVLEACEISLSLAPRSRSHLAGGSLAGRCENESAFGRIRRPDFWLVQTDASSCARVKLRNRICWRAMQAPGNRQTVHANPIRARADDDGGGAYKSECNSGASRSRRRDERGQSELARKDAFVLPTRARVRLVVARSLVPSGFAQAPLGRCERGGRFQFVANSYARSSRNGCGRGSLVAPLPPKSRLENSFATVVAAAAAVVVGFFRAVRARGERARRPAPATGAGRQVSARRGH